MKNLCHLPFICELNIVKAFYILFKDIFAIIMFNKEDESIYDDSYLIEK